LLVVKLDVTSSDDAKAAVRAAVDKFGRVDVLVNNAGNFIAGFFEEISADDFRAQVETNLFGPLNVTRAVLPGMRQHRSGLVIAISSTGGIVGQEFCSAYSASKFGLEGWIESLAPEVAPFGIHRWSSSRASSAPICSRPSRPGTPSPSIEDYAKRATQTVASWNSMTASRAAIRRSSPRR
jgi:short-subunit dehydrogenase